MTLCLLERSKYAYLTPIEHISSISTSQHRLKRHSAYDKILNGRYLLKGKPIIVCFFCPLEGKKSSEQKNINIYRVEGQTKSPYTMCEFYTNRIRAHTLPLPISNVGDKYFISFRLKQAEQYATN